MAQGTNPADSGFIWDAPPCTAVEAAQPNSTPTQHKRDPNPPQICSGSALRTALPRTDCSRGSGAVTQHSHTSWPGIATTAPPGCQEGKQHPQQPIRVTHTPAARRAPRTGVGAAGCQLGCGWCCTTASHNSRRAAESWEGTAGSVRLQCPCWAPQEGTALSRGRKGQRYVLSPSAAFVSSLVSR